MRLHSYAYEKRTLENLTNLVASYARSKREDLMKILPSGSSKRTVRCDTTELRQLIQVAFIKDYTSVRRDVINTQRLGAVRLRHLMSQAMPDSDIDINFDKLSDEYAVPNQIPLGQMLAIDLEESWWQRWWQRRSGAREAGEALEALIQQEFQPVVEELVAATRTELERVIEGAVLQLSIGSTKVLYAIENQQRQLAAPSHQGALAHPRSSDPTDYALLQIRRDMASNRHERTRRLCDEFSELTAICRRMIG